MMVKALAPNSLILCTKRIRHTGSATIWTVWFLRGRRKSKSRRRWGRTGFYRDALRAAPALIVEGGLVGGRQDKYEKNKKCGGRS